MIERAAIQNMTNFRSYARGINLYNQSNVIELEVNGKKGATLTQVTALVQGSGRKRYYVEFYYDHNVDEVDDIYCECPAFHSYEGICKHCVAALLEYIDYEEGEYIPMNAHLPYNRHKHPVRTTPEIKELLMAKATPVQVPLFSDNQMGNIRLEPFIKCNPYEITMELKVGEEQLYVVKSISEFAEAIQLKRYVQYGKKLKFLHTLEAFDEQSRALAKFVVELNKNKYLYAYDGYGGGGSKRSIHLSLDDLLHVFACFKGQALNVDIPETGLASWRYVDERIQRNMKIVGKENGVEITIEYLAGYADEKQYIYFHEGKIYQENIRDIEPIKDFLECMGQLPERKIFIVNEDLKVFCRDLLPKLNVHYHIDRENFNEEDYESDPVQFEIYLDTPNRDRVTCKVLACYGNHKVNLYERPDHKIIRETYKEIDVNQKISPFFNHFNTKTQELEIIDDENRIYELIVQGIDIFKKLGEVFVTDRLKNMNVVYKSKVAIGVSVESDLLELTIASEDLPKEVLIEVLSKYNPKKRYYRLKDGSFIHVEGEEIGSLYELKEGLKLTESQLRQDKLMLPKYRALYLDEQLKEDQSIAVARNKDFKALIRNMKTVEDSDFELPSEVEPILREYQKTGFLWLKTLQANGFGGILADDMGLGKSVQVITYILSEQQKKEANQNQKILIVSPASLVYNWKNEFIKFAPELTSTMVIGTVQEREQILSNLSNQEIAITSYDLLKRDIVKYQELNFHTMVIDEAQYIKNHNTQAAKAVKLVRAGYRLALTGTPIENRLSELWSIFDYLMPGFLHSYTKFKKEIEVPTVQSQDEQTMKRLQKMITPFILRRLKKNVLLDLPAKIEENLYVKMEGEQKQVYDARVNLMKLMLTNQSTEEFTQGKLQILAELTKLRQICCDPSLLLEEYKASSAKVEACLDLIREAVDGGHKILLFSQFTSMLDILTKRLEEEKVSYYVLTGATSKSKRSEMVNAFNEDDTSVFCISLKAGGTGLNLTAADIVIHFDPWWNVAVQNQATDRAHRIGQDNVVNVYKLIVKDTIEEKIVGLQEKKNALAEQVLNGEGISMATFSKEELLELLK
jgi:SNF2 family DNA or RNA helicase